ncbi:hypothetical protein HYALB_00009119 [Hymenoscyphus albidus]|uniref:Uncharacterized protein n=1 Tax=Hymenoscyphus albidus TaxID=595503 RepID=A0A9N9LNG1_9HELO|nr:hypothetical protein HYALB_00009119 [Hymenoscyphus albidus]
MRVSTFATLALMPLLALATEQYQQPTTPQPTTQTSTQTMTKTITVSEVVATVTSTSSRSSTSTSSSSSSSSTSTSSSSTSTPAASTFTPPVSVGTISKYTSAATGTGGIMAAPTPASSLLPISTVNSGAGNLKMGSAGLVVAVVIAAGFL